MEDLTSYYDDEILRVKVALVLCEPLDMPYPLLQAGRRKVADPRPYYLQFYQEEQRKLRRLQYEGEVLRCAAETSTY
jgi:hypothetical protein